MYIKLIFVVLVSCLSVQLSARHIVGGEVTYECVNQFTGRNEYRITLTMYRDDTDPNAAGFDSEINFGIYIGNHLMDTWRFDQTVVVRLDQEDRIIPESPSPCLTIPTFNLFKGVYEFTVTLPVISEDYMFAYQRCCRNNTINNIMNPGDQGAAFVAIMTAEGQGTCNNSPIFDAFPPVVICAGQSLNFNHGASDAEGDQLNYSFCAPLSAGGDGGTRPGDPPGASEQCDGVTPDPENCRPPFNEVVFRVPQFNQNQPLGGSPAVTIDPLTGRITGTPQLNGQFVVGVCVREFRNGQLIGEIRRDFQFNVETCTVNVGVDIDAEQVAPTQYRIRSCGENTVMINNLSEDQSKIFSYDWEFDFGGGNIYTSTQRSPTIDFPGVGDYLGKIVLNKTDSLCADSANVLVNVYPAIEADFTADYDTCIAGPVAFSDMSFTGASAITDWEWDFGDGETSTVPSPIHSYDEPSDYLTSLIVTDVNDCKDSLSTTFLWAPIPPLVVVEPSAFIGCKPGVVTFNNLSDPINELYDIQWDFGDGTTSDEISPTHVYSDPGTYSINVDITSPFGCTIGKRFNNWIEIRESPIADFIYSPEQPTVFNNVVDFTDQSTDAVSWIWDFGGSDFSIEQNPTFTFPDTGVYNITLVVQHPSGCTDTLTERVDIEPIVTLFFPNAFTPNSDGLNETFKGTGFIDGINNYTMTIWNRWGELLFETEDPTQGWNARKENNGPPVQDGVYVYTVEYLDPRGKMVNQKGTVTVVR